MPPNLEKAKKNVDMMTIWIIGFAVIIIFCVIVYVQSKMRLPTTECNNLSKIYPNFPPLSSFNPYDATYSHNLRDYYIKTAYNCCSAGQFKNDFVTECALKNAIGQGARCLDFEIYSLDNKPVIATSGVQDFSIKETYNSLEFSKAMSLINNYAFSDGTCPSPNDPLILHFRIMSSNKPMYKEMADGLYSTLGARMLGKKYSYEYDGLNLGSLPLKTFNAKVIIMVDKKNPLYEKTALDEYVNISSHSIFLRGLRNYEVVYTHDFKELIDYNKKNMSITMPDISAYNKNVSAALHMKYGCQMVAMCFQNFDSNMQYYNSVFDGVGSSYILKPEHLRFVPTTIPVPPPPDPQLSYAPRTEESDYYKFHT